jgi:hypothetical protein
MFCPIPPDGRPIGPDDALSGSYSGIEVPLCEVSVPQQLLAVSSPRSPFPDNFRIAVTCPEVYSVTHRCFVSAGNKNTPNLHATHPDRCQPKA